jgi:hypothetical protein
VVLATLGKREAESRGLSDLAPSEKVPVRRQALSISIRATIIALVVVLIALLI